MGENEEDKKKKNPCLSHLTRKTLYSEAFAQTGRTGSDERTAAARWARGRVRGRHSSSLTLNAFQNSIAQQ